jgi:Na+-translocating ferredoxin:NAD+ oxidoreductase RnfA subunit
MAGREPLAVTLHLVFAMKMLIQERMIVRHLSACKTMGSASDIHRVGEKVKAARAVITMSTAKDLEKLNSTMLWEVFGKLLLEGIF